MNILFVDICSNNEPNDLGSKLLYKLFGFYFVNFQNGKISALYIKNEYYNRKVLKVFLKYKYRQNRVYLVTSINVDKNKDRINIQDMCSNFIEITEQNNLLKTDKKYITDYLLKNNIPKEKVRILFVIDKFTDVIKNKINEYINEYKFVDLYVTGMSDYFYVKDYMHELNNNLGSVSQILDKMTLMNYNILLVFSHKHEDWFTECSFVLDYHDSDLDVGSNTYKLYLNHRNDIEIIFNKLKLDFKDFKKTKLGKLYIHKEWNALDI